MSRILKGVKPDNVYYCGGLGMQNVLAGICREEGAQFHPEVYDTGTAFVQGVEQYFASWRRKTAAVQQQKKRMQRKQSMLALISAYAKALQLEAKSKAAAAGSGCNASRKLPELLK
ncbi:hypothetical protein B484DRAFT_408045 [Ochromonadaceae sp. CCMP2298]|nr:hypothetical protein B484DRAFT_408045 [Ochromonadaceae sp. CCMP2298]